MKVLDFVQSGGPIFPLRKGPVLVSSRPLGAALATCPNGTPLPTPSPSCRAFGPWSASRPLAAVEGVEVREHDGSRVIRVGLSWSRTPRTPRAGFCED